VGSDWSLGSTVAAAKPVCSRGEFGIVGLTENGPAAELLIREVDCSGHDYILAERIEESNVKSSKSGKIFQRGIYADPAPGYPVQPLPAPCLAGAAGPVN
jgi:hypothetical protein